MGAIISSEKFTYDAEQRTFYANRTELTGSTSFLVKFAPNKIGIKSAVTGAVRIFELDREIRYNNQVVGWAYIWDDVFVIVYNC